MIHSLWIAKKNELCALVRKISDTLGGDNVEWLREYCKELVEKHKNNLDGALRYFRNVEKESKFYKQESST